MDITGVDSLSGKVLDLAEGSLEVLRVDRSSGCARKQNEKGQEVHGDGLDLTRQESVAGR